MRRAIPATLLVLALAGCGGGGAPTGNAAPWVTPTPTAFAGHPATGCWSVARPYIATLAHDLGKQAKLLHQATGQGASPQLRATVLDAEAHAWIPPGVYAADLNPFDQSTGFTCESGTVEDSKYPSEAQFDSDFTWLLNDISALQDGNGDVADYRAMRRDVAAVEADYQNQ
jgi:hypothetical protein